MNDKTMNDKIELTPAIELRNAMLSAEEARCIVQEVLNIDRFLVYIYSEIKEAAEQGDHIYSWDLIEGIVDEEIQIEQILRHLKTNGYAATLKEADGGFDPIRSYVQIEWYPKEEQQ